MHDKMHIDCEKNKHNNLNISLYESLSTHRVDLPAASVTFTNRTYFLFFYLYHPHTPVSLFPITLLRVF